MDTILSKITFYKSKDNKEGDITFDAINAHVCNLDSCKELRFDNYYYVNTLDEFQIHDDIYCKLINLQIDKDNVNSYSLEIYSYVLQLSELKLFIGELKKKFLYERNNKLDNLKYYFDEHHCPLMKNSNNAIKFTSAPNELSFTMTRFNTNKSLKNVFGSHLKLVKERMDLFTNNPEWYIKKGIPYTLGILLHGPPGTGKTSIIKAIAKDTNRHIFNIKLHADTTKTQLNNLFFNEDVAVLKNGKSEIYNIPLDERIYVMEDVDCDNEILLDRAFKTIEEPKTQTFTDFEQSFEARYDQYSNRDNFAHVPRKGTPRDNKEQYPVDILEDTTEKLTLSFILNILDGILETPGRILIMTSNYPEKLDKALIRPGRIDINLRVGYCDMPMIREIFKFFYEKDLPLTQCPLNNDITPAQLNKILLDNFNNSERAYTEIIKFISTKASTSS